MSDIFFWVIAAIMIGLGGYSNYTNWTIFFKAREAKATFLKNHKDGQETRINKGRFWWFVLLAVVCLFFAIYLSIADTESLSGASRWSQVAVYLGLCIFAIALIPENITDSKIVYTSDGFMFDTEYFRYKNINKFDIGNGFFKGTTMYMTGAKEIQLPKSIAKWALPQWEEYKENRREQRNRRGKKGRQG